MSSSKHQRGDSVVACHPPRVDASGRSVAPVAIGILVAFAMVWAAMSWPSLMTAWRIDQGHRVRAQEMRDGTLQFPDARGAMRTVEVPSLELHDRAADGTVALLVPEGDDLAPAPASGARTQLLLSAFLFLLVPGMLYGAWRLVLQLRADKERRVRLKTSATRLRARAVRIDAERVGGSKTRRTEYRAMVLFDGLDGTRYEAASDLFPSGEPPVIAVDGLGVLFDRTDPLESLVDEESPAMRAARKARPRSGFGN